MIPALRIYASIVASLYFRGHSILVLREFPGSEGLVWMFVVNVVQPSCFTSMSREGTVTVVLFSISKASPSWQSSEVYASSVYPSQRQTAFGVLVSLLRDKEVSASVIIHGKIFK